MTTTMLASTPTKEKKKVSSASKQNRSSVTNTLKRNPKVELKKDELIRLLGRFEAELQAKEVALAAMKSEKVKTLLSNARFGRLSCQSDPYAALLRDSEQVKEDVLSEQMPMKNAYETQLVQLEELIVQQRQQVHTLKSALSEAEQRFLMLAQELENEKQEKTRLQAVQNHLLLVEQEKYQFRNELNNVKLHNQELEQQLLQVMKLLEHEHERHKHFVLLLVNERQRENEYHKEQLKKLSNLHVNDDTQREVKFKQLENENERNKQVLTARIKQLQAEIDLLVKEKKQKSNPPSFDGEVNEVGSKPRQVPASTPPSVVHELPVPSSSNPEKISSIRRPTIIPTPSSSSSSSKNGTGQATKTGVIPPSTTARTQQPASASMTSSTSSISELSVSPAPTVAKRNVIPTRPTTTTTGQAPLMMSNLRSSPSNQTSSSVPLTIGVNRGGIPRLTKNSIAKPTSTTAVSATGPTKRTGQTSFSSKHKINDLQTLLEAIHAAAENRLRNSTASTDPSTSQTTDKNELKSTSSSSHSNSILFRAAENGDTDQLLKFLKLGSNPNSQTNDGNTCLHLAAINGHYESIRHLLKFGANPCIENHLGATPLNVLSRLNENIELECLRLFVEFGQILPSINLILDTIELGRMDTFDYLLSILSDELRENLTFLARLVRTALRSSNTHFIECLFALVTVQDFIRFIDENSFISTECLALLSSLKNEEVHSKPINLTVCISSSTSVPNREHRYSYAIGTLQLTCDMTWLELERTCIKLFMDHITQIDSPFDYIKCSVGCTTNSIDTLSLGPSKWHYQDSPNDDTTIPFTFARDYNIVNIHLKGIDTNSTESLAYNYFIPSPNLKNFLRYIEQNPYVGVYGAVYSQKQSLFEDLMRYLERPVVFSTNAKFRIIRFEFDSVTSLDDCIEELLEQDFFRTRQWTANSKGHHHSAKPLLFFANVQNGVGSDMLNLLLNAESISDTCQMLSYSSDDNLDSSLSSSTTATNYFFPSTFHLVITLSKRTWSTENDIYKKFKWIPFKIDSVPWNGLLKRHLWRRMIDVNIREARPVDNELIATLQWVTNVWQRYNECLQKLSLQDALLGPALFFDCPMEHEAIFDWLQTKWNTVVAPLVRELSMNKCVQPKSRSATAAATAIASSLRANSLEISTPYESVACTALYVLLHRAVSRDCPLTGQEREQYLLNFVGSRLEGSGSSSMISSASSSRASTPQPSGQCDFISIQLE